MHVEITKLNHFHRDIMDDVTARTQRIEEKVRQRLEQDYQAKELRYLEEAYTKVQDGLKEIDQEKNEIFSKTIMGCKIKLLNKRKEIMNRVFDKATENVVAFTKTEAYQEYMLTRIRNNIKQLGEGEYIVYVNQADAGLKEIIEAQIEHTTVEIEDSHSELIGGHRLFNQTANIFADDSLNKMIEDQKQAFLKNCDIRIEESRTKAEAISSDGKEGEK